MTQAIAASLTILYWLLSVLRVLAHRRRKIYPTTGSKKWRSAEETDDANYHGILGIGLCGVVVGVAGGLFVCYQQTLVLVIFGQLALCTASFASALDHLADPNM